MSEIKTLGVLTSGGDCAGLNAVIRAVAYHAIRRNPRGVIDVPLSEVTIGARTLDPDDALIRTARGLGIHLGDERSKARD